MKNITLSLVIPVYNEQKRLQKTFIELSKLKLSRDLKLDTVIFVNDGSTDKTEQVIQNYSKNDNKLDFKITLLNSEKNHGKGYALREGLRFVKSDYALTCDADMSTPLSEIEKFVKEMQKGTDFIVGTRKNGHSTVIKHQSPLRESLGKGFTILTKVILGIKGTDFTCGFKAFSPFAIASILDNAVINRWAYDAEWVLIAKKNSLTTKEIPVTWSNDSDTKVSLGKDIIFTMLELISIKKNDMTKSYSPARSAVPIFIKNNA